MTAWKRYDIEQWQHGVAGCSPREEPIPDAFTFNACGVCINPRVLGLAAKTWRVGIYTAQRPDGRWTAGVDVCFQKAGFCYGPLKVDADNFPEEWGAQVLQLTRTSLWIEKYTSPVYGGQIHRSEANAALRLISQKIQELTPSRVPIYTQLSLFDL